MSLTQPQLCLRLQQSHEPKLLPPLQFSLSLLSRMSLQRFTSIFRTGVRSYDRRFVLESLSTQIKVAKSLRRFDNRPRLIFSSTFVPVKTIFIGGIPVAEDSNGVQAYLLHPAQATFSAEYYYQLVEADIEVVMQRSNVVLLPIPSPLCPSVIHSNSD